MEDYTIKIGLKGYVINILYIFLQLIVLEVFWFFYRFAFIYTILFCAMIDIFNFISFFCFSLKIKFIVSGTSVDVKLPFQKKQLKFDFSEVMRVRKIFGIIYLRLETGITIHLSFLMDHYNRFFNDIKFCVRKKEYEEYKELEEKNCDVNERYDKFDE